MNREKLPTTFEEPMNAPITSLPQLVALRGSAMPTAWKCAGSVRKGPLSINPINEAAETGTGAHKCFEGLVLNGAIDWEGINDACDELGGDSEDVRFLCGKACKMWPKLREFFPSAMTEVAVDKDLPSLEIQGLKLTGHVDVISISGDVVRILDWKTGRKDANYSQQMKAYLTMVLLAFPQLSGGTATIAWVRDQEIQNYTMTQADAEAWLAELVERVVNWDGTYRPGTHCEYCPRNYDCPAANAIMRRDLAIMADVDVDALEHEGFAAIAAMPPDAAIELNRRASLVKNLATRAHDALKSYVQANGDIDGTDARLTLSVEPRRKVDPEKAWPVLEQMGFGDEDFASCIAMSITKLGSRVAEHAGKGQGAAAKRTLAEKLELAGAIEINEIVKLVEKRN